MFSLSLSLFLTVNAFALGCSSLKLVSSVCLTASLFVRISKAAQNVYSTTVSPTGARVVTGMGQPVLFFPFFQNTQVEGR